MIEAKQIRAARALLDWTRDDLARASGVSVASLNQIETENRAARSSSLDKIKGALEAAGVLFTDNSGVKMRSDLVTIYEGKVGTTKFFDDVYLTLLHGDREILFSGGQLQDFFNMVDKEFVQMHMQRMHALPDLRARMILSEGQKVESIADYVSYRIIPSVSESFITFYLYGQKLGIITWRPTPRALVLNDKYVSDAYRLQFEEMWRIARRLRDE